MLQPLAKARANSRNVTVVEGTWDRLNWQAEPVMRAIGPEFGKEGPKVKALIEQADGNSLKIAIETEGKAELGGYPITARHVTFTEAMPEGIFPAPMKDATVYVDVTLTPGLEAEGYAREVVRRLQEMRRQLNLNVDDCIVAEVTVDDPRVAGLIRSEWTAGISTEVRAEELIIHAPGDGTGPERQWALSHDWDVEGVPMRMGISRAAAE